MPLCRTLPTLCRFSAITFTTKTPVSTTDHPLFTQKYRHLSPNSPPTTENSELMTKNCEATCRIAENKTRQIGNLNTVNKTHHPEPGKPHQILNNATFITNESGYSQNRYVLLISSQKNIKDGVMGMPRVASRIASVGTTIFTEINNLAAARGDVLNLGQGKPDFDTPPEIIEATVEAMRAGKFNQYAPGVGVPAIRQGVADHAKRFYDMDVDPDGGVVICAGASEAVYAAVMGITNPGDEVILIEPYFDMYHSSVIHAGGTPVFVPLHPPNWQFNPDELRAAFSEKTAAILVNSPHNPTGRVYSREELTMIADLCKEFDALVISDEVYEHLTYDTAKHIPMATLPGMWERTITISSAAKTFSVTGWKVGWAYGYKPLVDAVWKVRMDISFAVHHASQYGVAHALGFDNTFYEEYLDMYIRKRDILLPGLEAAGLKPFAPEGAFYIMADFTDVFDGQAYDFAKHCINEVGVACIPPGTFFCDEHRHLGQTQVRFSFCMQDDTLAQAAERLQKLRG